MPFFIYDRPVIGYKKIRNKDRKSFLVTLEVPTGNLIYSSFAIGTIYDLSTTKDKYWHSLTEDKNHYYDFKLRANEVKILEIQRHDATKRLVESVKHHRYVGNYRQPYDVLEYVVGETLWPKSSFDTTEKDCTSGIHFFPELWMAKRW